MARITIMIGAAGALAAHAAADLSIRWSTIDGGGATSSGGPFVIHATLGQHDAAPLRAGGAFGSLPGFWPAPRIESCAADCDGSGSLNLDDVDCFATGFLGGDTATSDCDGNGVLNLDDIDCFASSFLAGCG